MVRIRYYYGRYRPGNYGSYTYSYGLSNGTYYLQHYLKSSNNTYGWYAWNAFDSDAFITFTEVSFTPATISLNSTNYITEEGAGSITATNTVTQIDAVNNATFTQANGSTLVFGNVAENITHTRVNGIENLTHLFWPVTENVSVSFGSLDENITHLITAIVEKTTVSTTPSLLRVCSIRQF